MKNWAIDLIESTKPHLPIQRSRAYIHHITLSKFTFIAGTKVIAYWHILKKNARIISGY